MVSMKDIAQRCGVSVATVSKALNDQPDIGAETRERIRSAAEEMGYVTNSAARALKANRTFNIGILFVDERNSGLTHEYFSSMLESLKVALCSQRSQNCLPNVGWCEVTDMLFHNNAKIGARYFPDELGVLKAGAAADIIVMDYKPFTPFSDENIDGHMIFGMTGRQCQTTIAAGKVLMLDRQLVGIDEEAENAHILEAAKKLWGELNHRTY